MHSFFYIGIALLSITVKPKAVLGAGEAALCRASPKQLKEGGVPLVLLTKDLADKLKGNPDCTDEQFEEPKDRILTTPDGNMGVTKFKLSEFRNPPDSKSAYPVVSLKTPASQNNLKNGLLFAVPKSTADLVTWGKLVHVSQILHSLEEKKPKKQGNGDKLKGNWETLSKQFEKMCIADGGKLCAQKFSQELMNSKNMIMKFFNDLPDNEKTNIRDKTW